MTINGATINGATINGTALTDEEQYQLWLRDPSAPCMHMVRIIGPDAYNGLPDVVDPILLSDRPFPGYHAVIRSIPSLSRQIGEGLTGQVSAGIGTLELDNPDGRLDTWVRYAVDGRKVQILHGDPDWEEDRFRVVYTAAIEALGRVDQTTISYKLRPLEYQENRPIQDVLIATGPSANAPVPILYGDCFNIEPVLVDSANATYQFHDGANVGAAQSVSAVRDGGIDFQTSAAAVSAVNAGTDTLSTGSAHGFLENTRVRFTGSAPPAPLALATDYWVIAAGLTTTDFRISATRGGAAIDITGTGTGATVTGYHWTADLATGLLYLDSTPSGQLTMDAVGYLSSASEILPHVLAATDVDPTSVGLIDRLVGDDSSAPGRIGVYVKDRTNRIAVAEQIARGMGMWYGYDRAGMFRMGRVLSPVIAVIGDYDAGRVLIRLDDMTAEGVTIERALRLTYGNRVRYQRNWTKQTALFAGVTDENRALYTGDGLIATASEPSSYDGTIYPSSVQPDVVDSVCAEAHTAGVVASALDFNGINCNWHVVCSMTVGRIGAALDIGDQFMVEWHRWMQPDGFLIGSAAFAGYPCVVVGLDDSPTDGTTRVTFYTYIGEQQAAA